VKEEPEEEDEDEEEDEEPSEERKGPAVAKGSSRADRMANRNQGVKDEHIPPSPNKKPPVKKEQTSPNKKSAAKSPAKHEEEESPSQPASKRVKIDHDE
jgi:hypothetical protein